MRRVTLVLICVASGEDELGLLCLGNLPSNTVVSW